MWLPLTVHAKIVLSRGTRAIRGHLVARAPEQGDRGRGRKVVRGLTAGTTGQVRLSSSEVLKDDGAQEHTHTLPHPGSSGRLGAPVTT